MKWSSQPGQRPLNLLSVWRAASELSGQWNTLSGLAPYISKDGGYSRWEGFSGGNIFFRKYAADSSLVWSVTLNSQDNTAIRSIAYDGLGSAVLAGSKLDLGNIYGMHSIKVSNVGYSVNPLSSQKPVSKPKEAYTLNPYPNPVERYFYLGGLQARAKVQLFVLQGRKVSQHRVEPNEPIPVWALKKGLYVWRANDGKRGWSGKVWKE